MQGMQLIYFEVAPLSIWKPTVALKKAGIKVSATCDTVVWTYYLFSKMIQAIVIQLTHIVSSDCILIDLKELSQIDSQRGPIFVFHRHNC